MNKSKTRTSESKNKLWDYKKTRVDFNKGYYEMRENWVSVKRGIPASETQQKTLQLLGWGRECVTEGGANVLIMSILEI